MPQNPWELDWTGVKTTPASGPSAAPGRAKTTPQDMMLLRDASSLAETERDARRTYADTRKSVIAMDTGPTHAAYLDAITPDPDGGIMDKIGGFLGAIPRAAVRDTTMSARDHLKTVSAQVALAAAQQQKGTASDSDMAQMRMSGVNPYKSVGENLRILDEAERTGAFRQHRATLKSKWISRYGSISAPGPNGMSYEEIAARQDALVNKALDVRKRGLPKPPPSVSRRTATGPLKVDMDGNPIR